MGYARDSSASRAWASPSLGHALEPSPSIFQVGRGGAASLHAPLVLLWRRSELCLEIWRFPWPWGYAKMDGLFHGKPHPEMGDDWGYPYFRQPLYIGSQHRGWYTYKILQIIRESFCNAAEFHTTSDINTLGLAQLHPISHSRRNNDICESVTSKKNNLFTSKPGSRKTNP